MNISKYLLRVSVLSCILLIAVSTKAQVVRERPASVMGSRFDITIVAEDTVSAAHHIEAVIAEMRRIEALISDWKPSSEISEVNRNAGIKPVKVAREVFDLAQRSLHFSKLTNGAFDISYAAMDQLWKFDGSMNVMPTPENIAKSVAKVGYQNVVLDSTECTIFLKLSGMKIGFGAMGKGYAADRGRELMETKGVKAGIVNASGDLTTWGTKPNGKAWRVGVTNPFDATKNITVLKMKRAAVTTSGSYEKFVSFEGKRYSHIINPVTGYPATGVISVTVLGPNAEIANGISTSLMVLAKEKRENFVGKFPEYQFLLVEEDGKIIKSSGFKGKVKRQLKKR